MIPLAECVAVLLCAGQSKRFGPGHKQLALLNGKPLAAHAAELSTYVPFLRRIAIVPPDAPQIEALLLAFGLDLVVNFNFEAGKDNSLRIGLAQALARGARGVLVLLGDMPHVSIAHLELLSAAADDDHGAISLAGEVRSPPTLIPAAAARLAIADSGRPVRRILGSMTEVVAPAWMLADYDLPEHFTAAGGSRAPHSWEDGCRATRGRLRNSTLAED